MSEMTEQTKAALLAAAEEADAEWLATQEDAANWRDLTSAPPVAAPPPAKKQKPNLAKTLTEASPDDLRFMAEELAARLPDLERQYPPKSRTNSKGIASVEESEHVKRAKNALHMLKGAIIEAEQSASVGVWREGIATSARARAEREVAFEYEAQKTAHEKQATKLTNALKDPSYGQVVMSRFRQEWSDDKRAALVEQRTAALTGIVEADVRTRQVEGDFPGSLQGVVTHTDKPLNANLVRQANGPDARAAAWAENMLTNAWGEDWRERAAKEGLMQDTNPAARSDYERPGSCPA